MAIGWLLISLLSTVLNIKTKIERVIDNKIKRRKQLGRLLNQTLLVGIILFFYINLSYKLAYKKICKKTKVDNFVLDEKKM